MGCEGVNWIQLILDAQNWDIPDSVMNNGVPNRKGISPSAEKPSTFQRKNLCHGVSYFESQE
jgi:hypothetical protein